MGRNPNLIEVTGVKDEIVDIDSFKKSVSVYKCEGEKGTYGKIQLNGKCNSVQLDHCKLIELHVDSVMSTVEVSNCQRVKVVVKPGATILSIAIDKTDGCQVYLSEETQGNPDFQIIAAKSSEMNLNVFEGGEVVEMPIPEQFKYTIDRSGDKPKIVSSVSELYSS